MPILPAPSAATSVLLRRDTWLALRGLDTAERAFTPPLMPLPLPPPPPSPSRYELHDQRHSCYEWFCLNRERWRLRRQNNWRCCIPCCYAQRCVARRGCCSRCPRYPLHLLLQPPRHSFWIPTALKRLHEWMRVGVLQLISEGHASACGGLGAKRSLLPRVLTGCKNKKNLFRCTISVRLSSSSSTAVLNTFSQPLR